MINFSSLNEWKLFIYEAGIWMLSTGRTTTLFKDYLFDSYVIELHRNSSVVLKGLDW